MTHAHPEGQAGAVAVAVAAAVVSSGGSSPAEFFEAVLVHTPDGETRARLKLAAGLPLTYDVRTAVSALGNGSQVLAQDTVPFALWCAARHLGAYEAALWSTVSGLGDRDTTCAIVGGIVALGDQAEIPGEWLGVAGGPRSHGAGTSAGRAATNPWRHLTDGSGTARDREVRVSVSSALADGGGLSEPGILVVLSLIEKRPSMYLG